jgi:hypothetical protein
MNVRLLTWPVLVALLSLVLCGCPSSGSDSVAVTGTITLNDAPLPRAFITFTPTGETRGLGASGRADQDGKYSLKGPRGTAGVPAGTYKVVISKLVLPDGTDFPDNSPVGPMDAGAAEKLPPHYADAAKTILTATVSAEGGTINFPLNSGESPMP